MSRAAQSAADAAHERILADAPENARAALRRNCAPTARGASNGPWPLSRQSTRRSGALPEQARRAVAPTARTIQPPAPRAGPVQASGAFVWSVQEHERRKLARELHDGISQNLTAIVNLIGLALAARYRNARPGKGARAAEMTLQETRELSRFLRPTMLDDLGLEAALRWLAHDGRSQRMANPWICQRRCLRWTASAPRWCSAWSRKA